ncbi:MAG: hypothetical protein AAF802_21455 [Planctomycetota bacterium]
MSPLENGYPEYFIAGPMVFTPASLEFAASLAASRAWNTKLMFSSSDLIGRFTDSQSFDGEELVVVTGFLPHPITQGYSDPQYTVLQSINSEPVLNINHAVELMRDCTDDQLVVEFREKSSEVLVFDREEFFNATEQVLNDSGIRRQGTEALVQTWSNQD